MSRRRELASALGLAVLAAVAMAQLWPGLSSDLSPPISWDHGSHIGKAMLTADELLPWSVRGWTDRVECGLPLGIIYTPAGTIWVLLFRALTPFLEWHQSYALALLAFRFLVGACVYRLARVCGAGALGATAGGVMALADWGDHSEGGWFYDVLYGVWPMSIAMCFFFFALADLIEYVERGRRAVGARAALLLGVALFSHQMSLVAFGLIVPCLVAARRFAKTPAALKDDLSRVLPVAVVAGLVAAWWMLPMLTMTSWLEDHGQLYRGALDMAERLVTGEAILNGGPWTNWLVAFGLGVALLSRGTRRALALGAIVAALFGSSDWLLGLDATRYLPSLGRIMYPRLMMVEKPLLFALGGLFVHDVVRTIGTLSRKGWRTPTGRVAMAAAVVLAIGVLRPIAPGLSEHFRTSTLERDVPTTATSNWEDWRAVWDWIESREDDAFYRVAYFSSSTHLPQAAIGYTSRPMHVSGVLVGEAFRNHSLSTDPEALLDMNVRYVVTDEGLAGGLAARTHPVTRFGRIAIFELDGWTGAVARAVRPEEGTPRVLALERERVVVDPGGATEIVIRRATGPSWSARADGVTVPIEEETVADSPSLHFVRLRVPRGARRVELVHDAFPPIFALGDLLTLLGLAIVALWSGALSDRAGPLARRARARLAELAGRAPPRARSSWPVLLCVAPFAGVLSLALWNARGTHLPTRVADAHGEIVRDAGGSTACTALPGGGLSCGAASIELTQVPIGGRYRSCLTAPPPAGGTLVLSWDDVALGSTLRVGAGVEDHTVFAPGGPIDVSVRIDGAPAGSLEVPVRRQWGEWVERTLEVPGGPGLHEVSIEVRSERSRGRPLCVDAISR